MFGVWTVGQKKKEDILRHNFGLQDITEQSISRENNHSHCSTILQNTNATCRQANTSSEQWSPVCLSFRARLAAI